MILRSQNGYGANDTSLLEWSRVPGSSIKFRLRKGPVTTVLLYLASRFDNEVEDIDTAQTYRQDAAPSIPGGEPSTLLDDWSYAPRPIRGSSTTLSNHASGTAIDLNATQHPRGRGSTFTREQVRRVRAILADLRDPATGRLVVRWGEDYESAPIDGMHFEINADPAAVARVAAGLEEDMYTLDQIAHAVQAYDGGGKLDAWRLLRDARNASQAAARDAAATLAIAKAQAAAGRPLTAAEVEAAAKAGAKAAIDEEIDSATVELNVSQP